MADRPIPFSAPMVAALLAGTKTQTRRAINPQPDWPEDGVVRTEITGPLLWPIGAHGGNCGAPVSSPKIKVGDRLYVREHWRTTQAFEDLSPSQMDDANTRIRYEADGLIDNKGKVFTHFHEGRFRQGMHMPRWASRLTLIVTDVRVERLQEISEADAIAEGVPADFLEHIHGPGGYRDIWDSINGPGAWDANPWVAAYTFTITPKNIDEA